MNPEAQRLAIAKACGWREAFPDNAPPHPETRRGGILLPYKWVNEGTHERVMELPDYLGDLNAMHEAVKLKNAEYKGWASWPQFKTSYPLMLEEVVAGRPLWDNGEYLGSYKEPRDAQQATAAQQAEAFLRTIEGCERRAE